MTHKQRVLELLRDGEPHSHREGYALGVMLHSRVSDLRRDGHEIECWRDGDLSMYRLVSLATSASSVASERTPQSASSSYGAEGSDVAGETLFDLPTPGAYKDAA